MQGGLVQYIIAGIDPGNTYGIAILSLSGRKLSLHSTDAGFSEAVRIIERHGTPSLVACDVSPAPEAAQKIASYFSCRLFVPNRGIMEEEKRIVASGVGTKNNHERDAYSSAVFAFRAHANKLRQIAAFPDLSEGEKERLQHLMLRGYRLKDAFLELREPEEKPEKKEHKRTEAQKVSIDDLKARVSFLARENANLKLMMGKLENERAQLQDRIRLLENGARQSLLHDSELRKLRFRLQQALQRLQPGRKPAEGSALSSAPAGAPAFDSPAGSSKSSGRKAAAVATQKKEEGKAERLHRENDDLNRLGSPNVDLEKMVTDYRRGRKQA